MNNPIKVIDLFSGPGGLGEGFSSVLNSQNSRVFKIAASIERDVSAHRTLKLRAFFRQFQVAPLEYYEFLKGNLGRTPEEQLYKIPEFKEQVEAAGMEALNLELGKDNDLIFSAISRAIGNDECILIGGPPCQAYSVAGVARNKSNKDYDPSLDTRNFLYKEYLKVIARFQPMLFVMENVKGMLSATVNGELIYKSIFKDLEYPSSSSGLDVKSKREHKYKIFSLVTASSGKYVLKPHDYIINCENFGIPQRRHRVILIGVREDLAENWEGFTLTPDANEVPIRNVIYDLPKLRSGLSKDTNTDVNWLKSIKSNSKQTVKSLMEHGHKGIAEKFIQAVASLTIPPDKQGANFGLLRNSSIEEPELRNWFYDEKLGQHICNHETRGHIHLDLQRYMFCSLWASVAFENNWSRLSPKAHEFPDALVPNHKNFKSGKFADRFRVQPANKPATTITCHISKDGHYYIHPDYLQCRSLTVREAARIQTFPDNYFFVGNRTQQYVQVGNAVPPLLSKKIANLIYEFLFDKIA